MLVLHILIALSSIAYTTYLYIRPSQKLFTPAYVLVGATLATGTALVLSTGSHLLSACISGLLYLSVVSFGLVLASRKLSRQEKI